MEIVKADFPDEDRNSVQEVSVAAKAASVTVPKERRGRTWRPEEEFNPQVVFGVSNARNERSGPASDDLVFSHLQYVSRTQFGQDQFGGGTKAL